MGKEKDRKIKIYGGWVRIKHSGLYDLEKLMSAIRGELFSWHYIPLDSEHSESVKSSGKEIRIVLTPFRSVSDYIRFSMEIEIVIYREIDVNVEDQGSTTTKQRGDIEIRLQATMEKNYNNTFKGPGAEFMRQTYEKYLIKGQLEDYEYKLRTEAEHIIKTIKTTLGSYAA